MPVLPDTKSPDLVVLTTELFHCLITFNLNLLFCLWAGICIIQEFVKNANSAQSQPQ